MPSRSVSPLSSVEMLRRLIAFPTVSRDSNLELIRFVRGILEPYGSEIRLTHDEAKRKANLFATLGPRGEPGIVLSGHTDVVPVEGQAWDTDPFAMAEKDGRLYGRGACDMKGFIACVLALIPEIMGRGLKTPLHLAFSYDEEVGCIGVGRLIADLRQAGIRPRSCIVGEPTEMRPVIAHKGKKSYRCTVRGLAGHSAYAPLGVNAVEYAAEAVAFLKQMARRHRDRGPYDRGFDIAHTTVHTGVIRGGSALNVIPHECAFDFEFRHLPGDDPDRLLSEFRDFVGTGLVRDRRLAVPACRHPDGGVRTGLDRAGAQAERVRDARSAHSLRGVPAPPRRSSLRKGVILITHHASCIANVRRKASCPFVVIVTTRERRARRIQPRST